AADRRGTRRRRGPQQRPRRPPRLCLDHHLLHVRAPAQQEGPRGRQPLEPGRTGSRQAAGRVRRPRGHRRPIRRRRLPDGGPVAFVLVILSPGFRGADQLGQNAPISLAVAVWGWVLAARGRQTWAGVVWGLFAFKPTLGMSLFLVPLVTGRWRLCLSMVLTG